MRPRSWPHLVRLLLRLPATRTRAAHHQPDDVPEPANGGGAAEPAARTVLLGVDRHLPAAHTTLALPGTAGCMKK